MNDFLQFLNTADIDSLTQLPGISHSLAENLIAARPFNSIDECLEVRGMGKNLLSRAMSSFGTAETEPNDGDELIEEDEAMPMEKYQPVTKAALEDKPSFAARAGQVLLNVFRALLRLILLVMLILAVGAAIYYGAPYLRERFIAPVEQNAARVSQLENDVAHLQSQLTDINDQITETNNQLTETNSRIDEIEQSVEALTVSLEKLEAMQTTLETQLKENDNKTLLALKHEVMLTRVLDVLARARLYLAESNFGLAREDVRSARELLVELEAGANDEVLTQAISRLDLALGNLPAFPVVASGDLEVAWQILMTGEIIATATPVPTSTGTPAPAVPTVGTTLTITAAS